MDEGGGSSSATTSASTTSGTSIDPSDTSAATDDDADPTSASTPTEEGPGATDSSTTAVDHTTSEGSSSETGVQPGCADFDGRVVHVNMEPVSLTMGLADNAPGNVTSTEALVGDRPGYSTADADEVFEAVLGHFAPFHVCLTRELPQVADYPMLVLSSETYMGNPNNPGPGLTDCDDAMLDSVNVLILAEEAGLAIPIKAIAVSKFIAQMYGLGSIEDGPDDIMNFPIGTTLNGATFTETCYPVFGTFVCDSSVSCTAGEQQSGPYLEALFGPA